MTLRPGERLTLLSPMLFALLAMLLVAPPEIHPAGAVGGALLLAVLAAVLMSGHPHRPAPGERAFLLAAAGPLLLSHAFAVDQGGSVDSLVRAGGALAVFAAARRLSARESSGMLALLAAGGAVLALHGIWQAALGFDALLARDGLPEGVAGRLASGRIFARFLLPSVLASFLLLAWPLAAALALAARGWRRAAAAAGLALMAGALVLTRSHGALLALALAAALWWAMGERRAVRRTGVVAALALAALVLVSLARGGVILSPAGDSGPAALRVRNLAAAARMIADAPLTGVGGGGFGSAYTRYRQPGDNETRFVHNAYVQMIAEHGLPVALPLGAALACVGAAVHRRRRDPDPLARGAAFGLLAFLLHGAWDVAPLLPSTLWIAAAVAGVLAGPPAAVSAALPWTGRTGWRLAAWAVTLLLAAAGVASGAAAWHLSAARAALDGGDHAGALRHVGQGQGWAPWRADLPLLEAEILMRHPALGGGPEAARQRALAAATRAVERNRCWPAAHAVRARLRAAAGDPGGAAADLTRAADLYPLAGRYRRELEALADGVDRWRASGSER